MLKPRLFIASSIEARPTALKIRELIKATYEVDVWTEGFFQPGASTFSSIATRIRDFDGGIFILSPDDRLISRGREGWTPRANVLFELGMFAGVLGIGNCIQVVLKVTPEVTPTTLSEWVSGTWQHASERVHSLLDVWGKDIRGRSTGQRGIEPISDLAGITWIEAKATERNVGGRFEVRLTEAGEKSVASAFTARAARDQLTLHALRSNSKLRAAWYHMDTEDPGDAELVAFGDRVRAAFTWTRMGRKYQVSLRFEAEDRLVGEWWDATERGYGGSASFQVRQSPSYLLGEWVGWSTNGGVKSGAFVIAGGESWDLAKKDREVVRQAHEMRHAAKPPAGPLPAVT